MASVFQEIPIEQLCSKVTTGATPLRSRSDFYDGGTTDWYKTGELKDWYLGPAEERITKKALEETSVKLFPANTVLMAMYGDGRTITSLGMLRAPAATNQACSAMLVDEGKCDARYFFYALKGRRHLLLKVASGGAQRNLSGKLIKEFKLPVPPLPVQRRIAGILSAYDELMENSQRRIRILEAMARALYREWFVHFRFPGHETHPRVASPLGDIPKGWELSCYGEAADFENGDRGKNYPNGSDFVGEGVPFVNAGHLVDGAVDLAQVNWITETKFEQLRSGKIREGDLLFCLRGSPGRTARVGKLRQAAIASSLVIIRPTARTNKEFLFQTLSSEQGQQMVAELDNGAAQPNVSVGSIQKYPLLLPPKDILNKFADHVEQNWTFIDMLRAKMQNLRRTRDLLLPRLLSGQVELESVGATELDGRLPKSQRVRYGVRESR